MNNTTNNTDTDLSSPFVGQNLSIAARALLATVGGIMILCGVLGNGLLIIVVVGRIRRRQHQCLYDLFLFNLALSDLVTLGYWMTFFVLDMILGYHPVVNQAHCVMNGMTICVMSGVCMLSLLAISLDRYLYVRHFLLYQRLFTWSRTVVICIVIWILAILAYIPPALNLGGSAYLYSATIHQCIFETSFSYTQLMIVSSTIISVIVIGYCDFAIHRFWKKANDALHGSKEQSGIRKLFNRRKKAPPNSGQTTGVASMTVGEVQTPEAPEPSLSTRTSVRETPSKRSGEKHPTFGTQKSQQRQKKLNSSEVAFMRSKFVVFILGCVTYIPFGIIMAVHSVVTVPAEFRIIGLLLIFSNSSVNWLVYGVMNPSFRRVYKKCARQVLGKTLSRKIKLDSQRTLDISLEDE